MTDDGDSDALITRRDVVSSLMAVAGWCGFAWFVFWQGTAGQPIIWTDSTSYATVAGHPFWSTGFWAGQRPPLVPFVLKLAGSATGFVAVQSVVAVGAWGFLAFTAGRLVPPGWRRVVAVFAVLAFATSTPVTLWNRSVLSESFSLSFLALLLAATIWTARRVTWPRVAAVAATAVAFALTRDAQVWTVAILGVVTGLVALVQARRRRRLPRRIAALAVSLLLVAAGAGWLVVHTGRTQQNVADVLYVRVFPFASRVAWFAHHGMPEAGAVDRLAATTPAPTPGSAKVVGFDPTDPKFGALEHWIVTRGQSTYVLWLVTHPLYVITEPLLRPERSYNFADGDLTFYAALGRVDSPLSPVLWPTWWWLLPLSAVALGVAAVGDLWRQASWRAVLMLGGLGVLSMLIAWHGDGQEVTRHTVEGFAEVRVCVLIVAVVGVLRALPRRRGRPAHSRSAAGTGAGDGDEVAPPSELAAH